MYSTSELFFNSEQRQISLGKFRVIEIPTISTTGRVDGDRETIGTKKRNFNNSWTPLTLENHRTGRHWFTREILMKPTGSIHCEHYSGIQRRAEVPRNERLLHFKDLFEWTGKSKTADKTVLTTENVLEVFDKMMTDMDNNRVPRAGRILYVTPEVRTLINNAKQIYTNLGC